MNKPTLSPLVLQVENITDKVISTSLFELRHRHDGVRWKNIQGGVNVGNVKLFYLKNPDVIKAIRMSWESPHDEIYFRPLYKAHVHPSGVILETPICVVGNVIDPAQTVINSIQFATKINMDGAASDIAFKISPKEVITFAMYFDEDEPVEYKVFKPLRTIIVENNSDTEQIVDIFNKESYAEYVNDGIVKFYDLWRGPDQWGCKFSNSEDYVYKFYSDEKYNFLKITNPSKNTHGIITAPGTNIRPEEHVNQFGNEIAIDINLPEAQWMTQFIINPIPPKTKIMYSFGMQP